MSLPHRPFIIEPFNWRGIAIEVRYTPSWLESFETVFRRSLALIEVTRLSPEHAVLPITETGYTSRFLAPDDVDACGGPTAYVKAWLDEAAALPAWRKREIEARQMSLF